ncbi:HEAT repeat domain-containing protein [Halomicroarcula sp. S1AR25-4]|uniref:HEAT repeat domain-containing protein n=1 Tax=Haloarcula sp. S1AR25-4 TaxID=2950538 RepID=UPI0028759C24|nr:HEAT repeat domain-containing protein [Halomicroarcula sp. S1AR25-4]MDS0279754.1 HEAT repeat domain-containing protein [Halomicroarcula sp. S1AR25-4]
MSDPDQPPAPDHLPELLNEGAHEVAVGCLDRLGAADAETRKRALRAVRAVAAGPSRSFEELVGPLSTFLTDEDRAVRLTTAKLFVALAQSEPATVLLVGDALAERVADDEEFYYVRARCAEALGYVAVDSPAEVTDPGTLADLRIGLSFDEPEVKEKLAKALAYVALGDPDRLRHQVDSLAEHLNDENKLVRYHLCTALVVVGCAHPAKLADAEDMLRERLTDESPYVRGRAAEALGVLTASGVEIESTPALDDTDAEGGETPPFLTDRVRFCRRRVADEYSESPPAGVGTIESIREGTDAVVEEMLSPDGGGCPHCGLALPEGGPPMCPRCGVPR